MKPIVRGVIAGLAGFFLGYALVFYVNVLFGRPNSHGAAFVIGYGLGLGGWLLGVGAWDEWIAGWFGLPTKLDRRDRWRRYLRFDTDHKVIGIQYLSTFVVVLLLAGAIAMVIRAEMMTPGTSFLKPAVYNQVMSMHGILMIAVAVAAVLGGFGNYIVPLMIGAEDMAFPRLNALSFWLIPPVAVLLLTAPFGGGWDSGWTAYPPLAETNAFGQVMFNLAIITFGLSSILGGLNFLTTVARLRTKGMTWGRLPIFVWSVVGASIIALLFTQYFAASLLLELIDRIGGTVFFNGIAGGKPLLYEHLFWFYSHPAVYIMIIPGFGVALEVISAFSRKPLFGYKMAVGAILAIVGLSAIVWAHHMFTSGMSNYLRGPFMALTELISIPTGVIFLCAVGTMWRGRLWLRTPMLFALAFIANFMIGGITGIFLADVATDINLQDTYFVVAHFHYTIMGGLVFEMFAAIYYWFPKMTGRMYRESLGKIHAWWMWIFFNLTFLPMFWVGLNGQNRRVASYQPEMTTANRIASVAAFILGASFLVFVVNMLWSLRRGERAIGNPWGVHTLEWQTSSPPPTENFPEPPVVVGSPYVFGTPGAVHLAGAAAGGDGEMSGAVTVGEGER